MGKGANKHLFENSGTGQERSKTVFNQGQDVGGYLTPKLKSEAENPEGYTPQQLAYMSTAAQQSEGGAVGGITGEANLEAARTGNAGGFEGAIGSGSRAAQRDLSQKALEVQGKQADLQQQQKQQAMDQLMKLYGVDEQTALQYLNASTAANAAEKTPGMGAQLLNTAITGGAAVGAAAAKHG